MDNEERKDAMKAAFEAAHYRKPTKKEAERIDKAVDGRSGPGGDRKRGGA